MPSNFRVGDIRAAIAERAFPTVTVWNRLEGRPRTTSFDRALRAEVRDALWMLTKQWQMGEFRGSDAGSPVFAKLQLATTRLTKYRPDDKDAELLGGDVPLEAKVERRPVALSLDLRLLMGRQWLALVADVADYRGAFVDAYPIVPPDPTKREDAADAAHPEVRQLFAAVAGRAMDGGALYEHLVGGAGNHSYDGVVGHRPRGSRRARGPRGALPRVVRAAHPPAAARWGRRVDPAAPRVPVRGVGARARRGREGLRRRGVLRGTARLVQPRRRRGRARRGARIGRHRPPS